jgi:hypothetical protein
MIRGLFIPDPDPGSRGQKGIGSRIRNLLHCALININMQLLRTFFLIIELGTVHNGTVRKIFQEQFIS